jgi:predicted O-linked N-acetylglucosamine transferase (SPINDLY family)
MTRDAIADPLGPAARYLEAGEYAQAQAVARKVLAADPSNALATLILASVPIVQSQPEIFRDMMFRGGAETINDADLAAAIGNLFLAMHKNDKAIAAFGRAVALRPDHEIALRHLAYVLRITGKLHESIAAQERLVAVTPQSIDARITLAETLHQAAEFDRCIAVFDAAIAKGAGSASIFNTLSAALFRVDQHERATAAAKKALEYEPNYPEALINLSNGLRGLGRFAESEAACRKAIALRPDDADAQLTLSGCLSESGRLPQALALLRECLQREPDDERVLGSVAMLVNYDTESAVEILAAARQFDERLCKQLRPKLVFENAPDPNRRLRVGYVSPDFRDHVVGRNILPLLREHDHEQFEIFCYSNVLKPDALTAKMKSYADGWRRIVAVGDAEAADLICNDHIDVLVDLALHTGGSRLCIFARKPAPVQVTFAGYPGGTGLATMDYRLTDPYLDPPAPASAPDPADGLYVEKSFRLPHSFWCYEGQPSDPPVSELPALSAGHVTFGSLNAFRKISPATWARWAAVLHAVPGAELMVLAPEESAREMATRILGGHGIDPNRLRFISTKPRSQYMSIYHRIDIGLDTLPYNGHTTSLDSYWMGVPVVTLVGQTVVGRAGLSQATNLGMTELIGWTEEEFVAIATRLAGDLPGLSELRRGLRARMRQSPLCDAKGFTRGIEGAYRQMWQTWCARAGLAGQAG